MITHTPEEKDRKAEVLIVPVWEDKPFEKYVRDLDRRFDGLLTEVFESKDFEGKSKQTSLVYTSNKQVPRLLMVGLGKLDAFCILGWKQAVGAAVIAAQGKKLTKLELVLPAAAAKKLGGKKLGSQTTIAVDMANYAYDEYKSDEDARVKRVTSVKLVGDLTPQTSKALQEGIAEGRTVAEAVNYVRHLGNTPPTTMTPAYIAGEAVKMAEKYKNMKVQVLSRPEMKKLGMGCLLGVSRGSAEEPKFIALEYQGGAKGDKPTVLVGKGITFDSGGLSLKPFEFMFNMKFDMLGAASVLGVIQAAAELKLKKNIVGLVPSCENMPGGEAYRPDDILVAMNGRSVHVENTDAEGRLILADALSYAARYEPKEVIDFATLTGACMVALGNERSGLFSTDEKIAGRLMKSSEAVGEQLWRLPLGEEFSEAIQTPVADVSNMGSGVGHPRYGGASTAAAFLQFFTLNQKTSEPLYPWAHIDLSCSYYTGKGKSWIRWGANGFGVQTMIEYLSA